MTRPNDQAGFTLIELLVAVLLFSVASAGFYTVMFSSVQGSDTAERVTRISEEARAGFNRMVRDAREAQDLQLSLSDEFRVRTDFDDPPDGLFENPNATGDYEDLTYRFMAGSGVITLNGETLIAGVVEVPGQDLFSYSSNLLEYDWDDDGVTSCLEIDEAASHGVLAVGNGNGSCDGPEHDFLTNIDFVFNVEVGDSTQEFVAQAQLRNRR